MSDAAAARTSSLHDMNRIIRRSDSGAVTAASLIGLWLLIPLALGALAYVLVGTWLLMSPFDRGLVIDWKPWLLLTLLLQAGHWTLVSRAAGRSPLNGLWGLAPFVALVPTFAIARSALLHQSSDR